MKVKLLKRLHRESSNEITIYSVTTTNGIVTGMKIGYNDDRYKGLFKFGNDKQDVMRKVFRLYVESRLEWLRKKYHKKSSNI